MSEEFDPTEWITTAEAAELTGYTARNVLRAINKGRLHGVKRGGTWFLLRGDVLIYAEKMKRLGSQKHDPWRTGARTREASGEN